MHLTLWELEVFVDISNKLAPPPTPYQKLVCCVRVTVCYKGTKMLPFSQTHATKSGNHMVKSFSVCDTQCPV